MKSKSKTTEQAERPEMLDAVAVAQLCDCSVEQIRKLRMRGEFPAPVRLGGLVRWPRESITRWLNAGCPSLDDCDFVRAETYPR